MDAYKGRRYALSPYPMGRFLLLTIMLALLFPLSLLSGCATSQTIPAPASAASSMMLLEAKLVGNTWRNKAPRPPTNVYLRRIGDGARIKQTARSKRYFIYANVPQGRYEVDAAELITGGGTIPVAGIIRGTISVPEVKTQFPFNAQTRQRTALTLKANTVGYMGEFTGQYAHSPVLFQHKTLYKWDVLGTSGERTREGKTRAFDFMKKNHPESEWARMLK